MISGSILWSAALASAIVYALPVAADVLHRIDCWANPSDDDDDFDDYANDEA